MNIVNQLSDRTTIRVTRETYTKLSHLGFTGESFDTLINRLIDVVIEANKKDEEED
jgi:predicted CopG family antitoxin